MIATRSVVEAEFGRALRSRHSNKRNSVLLLRAAPEWRGDREFSVTIEGDQVPVAVAPCPTVLAVLDAMGAAREDGRYLVVLTPCDSRDVGDSVLARAMQPEIKPINRWDLVADAFGARGLDPALTRSDRRWVAEALLDAQPPGGWRRLACPVLTEAAALNRLAATRLGIEDADGSAVDAAALLQWTTHPDAVASFLQLRETERDGLVQWLDQTAAPVAGIVFAMAGPGKLIDAVPFGLVIAALYSDEHPAPDTLTARVRAEERYLGGHSPGPAALVAFGVAAESLVARWTDNGRAPQAAEQCERAEAILRDLAGSREMVLVLAGHSGVLEAGLDARLGALGDAISAALANPVGETLAAAAKALGQVYKHGRTRDRAVEIRMAEAALRLTRWLASAEEPPRRWPRPRRGCSGRGPGPTGPWSASPAPTPAGCRALARCMRVCGTRPRPAAPGSTRRSRVSWRPGHKAQPPPMACCWWKTCSTGLSAHWRGSGHRSSWCSTG